MEGISIIKNMPLVASDKQALSSMVDSYIMELAMHGGDPLKDLALCKKYMFLLEELEKGIKSYVIDELDKEEKNQATILGVEMKVVEAGVKFDYSDSKTWVEQKKVVDRETAKLKEIEVFIKSLKTKTTTVDPETGEAVDFFPASRSSSTSVRATIQ